MKEMFRSAVGKNPMISFLLYEVGVYIPSMRLEHPMLCLSNCG